MVLGTVTTPVVPSGPAPPRAPNPRGLFAIAVVAALLGLVITLSFGYADHDPRAHGARVIVVGSSEVVTRVKTGLEDAEPGGFNVVSADGLRAAVRDVLSQTSVGALVVPGRGPITIVTAGAEGVLQQQATVGALMGVTRSWLRPAKLLDVAPLPAGDRSGLSSFAFGLGLLIPSVIGGLGLFLLGMRLRLWWRVAAAALFALLASCGGAFAMGPVLGALTGAEGALIGIGFLGVLSFVLFVAALQAVVGLPGTALAAVGFIFVGNAISGGSVPIGFLPDGFRQIAPWLPNSAIIRGTRDVVYFHGHDLVHPLLVLALWPVVALCILAAVDVIHVSERRRRPHNQHAIYGTPAVVHISRRLAARHNLMNEAEARGGALREEPGPASSEAGDLATVDVEDLPRNVSG